MMTKRNSTMIAPAYTSTWIAAMNCAPSITKMAASANIVYTSHIAARDRVPLEDAHAPRHAPPRTAKIQNTVSRHLLTLRIGRVPQGRDRVGLRRAAARGRTRTGSGEYSEFS